MRDFTVVDFMRWHLTAFLVLLAAMVAFQMLVGRISLRGLLRDKRDGRLSPTRIQALVLTLTGGIAYLGSVALHTMDASLPPAPDALLMTLGGSHAIYLGGKLGSAFNLWSRWTANSRQRSTT